MAQDLPLRVSFAADLKQPGEEVVTRRGIMFHGHAAQQLTTAIENFLTKLAIKADQSEGHTAGAKLCCFSQFGRIVAK